MAFVFTWEINIAANISLSRITFPMPVFPPFPPQKRLDNKYMYVCHAEMNAILNKNSANVEGCSIYVALFPCNECAKMIIQSGIKEVVFYSDKHHAKPETVASRRMLGMAGVRTRQFEPKMKRIVIDFEAVNEL